MARLDVAVEPPGYRAGEWPACCRVMSAFLDHHAVEAARLGWGTLDVFGLDPGIGVIRLDRCGALTMPSQHLVSVVAAEAVVFGPLRHRRHPLPPLLVPVWEVKGATQPQSRGEWRWRG